MLRSRISAEFRLHVTLRYFRRLIDPWVQHDVNPRQKQRRLIRQLRTILRGFLIEGMLRYLEICAFAYRVFLVR